MTAPGNSTGRAGTELLSGIRVFPELRSAHVTDIDQAAPRRLLYFAAKYDLGSLDLPEHISKVSFARALRAVRTHPGPVLELWEPLWLRMLPRWLALAAVWKIGRRGRVISVFAIENNGLDVLLGKAYSRRSRRLRRLVLMAIRRGVTNRIDRLAFGTSASRSVYAPIMDDSRTATADFLDLLRPDEHRSEPRALHAAFVGALAQRKGLPQVLRAWTEVERRVADAKMTIIGDGPERADAERWAAERPRSRSWAGAMPREQVRQVLRGTSVLVAPSVAEGRWREQVGRPIQEALAAGCTIVTTADTGLATYLADSGHKVLRDPSDLELATAVSDALRNPLDVAEIQRGLPRVDGRIAADSWLHREPAPPHRLDSR